MTGLTRCVSALTAVIVSLALTGAVLAETPRVDSLDPASGKPDESTHVRATGDGFEPGARVALLNGGVHVAEQWLSSPITHYPRILVVFEDELWAGLSSRMTSTNYLTRCDAGVPMNCHTFEDLPLEGSSVAVTQDYVVLLERGLLIADKTMFDPSFPGGPTDGLIQRLELASHFVDMAASGTSAFTAHSRSFPPSLPIERSLWTYDFSDFSSPSRFGPFELNTYPGDLVTHGDHLFVAGLGRLETFDVSDLSAPLLVGGYDFEGRLLKLVTQDDVAYLVTTTLVNTFTLSVLDISDPASPTLLGSRFVPDFDARELAVGGSKVHVIGFPRAVPSTGLGPDLLVFDVSDSTAPEQLITYKGFDLGFPEDAVAAVDEYVFMPSLWPRGLLQAIDVSETNAPESVVSSHSIRFYGDIPVFGDLAFIQGAGLQVLDVSDPTRPDPIGAYDEGDLFGLYEFYVQGDYAFVATVSFTSEGANDQEAGTLDSTANPEPPAASSVSGPIRPGNTARAFSTGLSVVDISDPTRPSLAGQLMKDDWFVERMAVSGDRVYLLGYSSSGGPLLLVIDVGNPRAPVILAERYMNQISDIEAIDHYLHRPSYPGVRVYDLSDPGSLELVGTYGTYFVHDIEIMGHLAVLTSGNRVEIYDVGNPAAASLVGFYDFGVPAGSVYLAGDVAIVMNGKYGINVLDLGDPSVPTLIAHYGIQLRGVGMSAGRDHLFVSNNGLKVLKLHPPLREISTPSPTALEFTVPAGYPEGPYHVHVSNPDGETETKFNAFRICDVGAFDATLDQTGTVGLSGGQDYRVKCTGDPSWFEPLPGHTASLRLPELPGSLRIDQLPGDGSGSTSVELRVSEDGNSGIVVLTGDDPAAALAEWDAAVLLGGWPMPRLDAYRYGDVGLQVRRRIPAGRRGPLRSAPSIVDLTGDSYPVVYRYDIDDDGLLAFAGASGVGVDLVIEVLAGERSGCGSSVELSVFDANQTVSAPTIPSRRPGIVSLEQRD